MAEYNVQINKYNANNLGYDQLYPQPMKHADTHLLNGSDPINVGELGVSNRNLLDNWYFGNPIDQRGGYVVPPDTPYYSDTGLSTQVGTVSAYTTAKPGNDTYGTITVSGTTYYVAWSADVRGYVGAGYGPDRWKSVNNYCTILVGESGISISASGGTAFFRQIIDNPEEYYGRVVTISTLTADGKLYTATGTVPKIAGSSYINVALATITSGNAIHMVLVLDSDGSIHLQFRIGNGLSVTVSAAKLELGTVQTLAHQDENGNWVLNDPPPDKGMELLKCQRYFIRIGVPAAQENGAIGFANCATTTLANSCINTPVTMRALPTATLKNIVLRKGITDFNVTECNVFAITNNGIYINFVSSGLPAGDTLLIRTVTGGYIDFIADL